MQDNTGGRSAQSKVAYSVHVLDPDGIYRAIKDHPLAVWSGVPSSIAEQHSQNTVSPLIVQTLHTEDKALSVPEQGSLSATVSNQAPQTDLCCAMQGKLDVCFRRMYLLVQV